MPIQELLTFDDLRGLDSSPEDVRSKFRNEYGCQPDGISVNNEGKFAAYHPIITDSYHHPSYKTLGQYNFTGDSQTEPSSVVLGSNWVTNHSDDEASIALTVGGSWTQSTTVSSSITSGMTFSSEFGIEGIFKMGMSFSLSVTAGQSSTKSTTKEVSSTVTVKVPPRSKALVKMVGTAKRETMKFQVPIRVTGMFGANFPDRVKGHYFWFMDVASALPKTSGEITGEITGSTTVDFNTEIEKPVPIYNLLSKLLTNFVGTVYLAMVLLALKSLKTFLYINSAHCTVYIAN